MRRIKNYEKILMSIFTIIIFSSFFVSRAKAIGELESVYEKYTNAIKNLDIEQFKKFSTTETIDKINATPAEQIRPTLETMKNLFSRDVAVSGERVNGDTGTLLLTGTNPLTGKMQKGTVDFIKENGQWKIKQERWVNKE